MNGYEDRGFVVSVDFNAPKRTRPVVHAAVEAPMCGQCARFGFCFFDLECEDCAALLTSPRTTVADLFAVLRQWTPQVQCQLDTIVQEIFRRGGHVNDRDGLTDMTMLHYAAKSGAQGDEQLAVSVVEYLLSEDAQLNARSKWTDMSALQYAVYFDVPSVALTLIRHGADIDARCSELDNGTALHIAASQLSLDSTRILLDNGCKKEVTDDMLRTPHECLPPVDDLPEPLAPVHRALFDLLAPPGVPRPEPRPLMRMEPQEPPMEPPEQEQRNFVPRSPATRRRREANHQPQPPAQPPTQPPPPPPQPSTAVSAKVTMQAMGLHLGDRVTVGGVRTGQLRYCGPVEFAAGVWAGVELDEPVGKNSGQVAGVRYFTCAPQHGVFAPISRVTKAGTNVHSRARSAGPLVRSQSRVEVGRSPRVSNAQPVHVGRVDVSRVSAKVDTGRRPRTPVTATGDEISVGDRVVVGGQRRGTIRYVGATEFAPGQWYGIELDRPVGKNDGSVGGRRYFSCPDKFGIFAPPSRLQRLPSFVELELPDSSSGGTRSRSGSADSDGPGYYGSLGRQRGRRPMIIGGGISDNAQEEKFMLREGMLVLCTLNNEIGTIRYIGPTHFAEGIWLGLELRTDRGRHDGSVQDHRYFTCRPSRGIMVRPSKVSVHGINGAKLLPPDMSAMERSTDGTV